MLNELVWEKVTPLQFKSTFCEFWRDCHGDWQAQFVDMARLYQLKGVDSLKEAIETVENLWLSKKYLPKPIKEKKKRKKKDDFTPKAKPKSSKRGVRNSTKRTNVSSSKKN